MISPRITKLICVFTVYEKFCCQDGDCNSLISTVGQLIFTGIAYPGYQILPSIRIHIYSGQKLFVLVFQRDFVINIDLKQRGTYDVIWQNRSFDGSQTRAVAFQAMLLPTEILMH